jgi:hypothetical protein
MSSDSRRAPARSCCSRDARWNPLIVWSAVFFLLSTIRGPMLGTAEERFHRLFVLCVVWGDIMPKLVCKCGAEFEIATDRIGKLSGQQVKCKACGRMATVPEGKTKETPLNEPSAPQQATLTTRERIRSWINIHPRLKWTAGIAAVAIVFGSVGIPIVWMVYESTRGSQDAQPQGLSLSADEVFAKASPAVVRVEVHDSQFQLIGQGSGFLVSEDGLIATNHHVVQSAYFAHVILNDGTKYPVEGVAALDRNADLALLQIKGLQLPVLKVATTDLPQVGARVYAIGNPKGLINSLSDGLISGHRKRDDDVTLIQTTVPISPGSSGGPLLSDDGRAFPIG